MALASPPVISTIVRDYASLQARFRNLFARRPLVLPNRRFFPDVFTGDRDSLHRLLAVMQKHAGLLSLAIHPRVIVPEGEASGGGCSGGGCGGSSGCSGGESSGMHEACGGDCGDECACARDIDTTVRLERTETGLVLSFLDHDLDTPDVLAIQIARALGRALLMGDEGGIVPNGQTDLAAIGLGFGALVVEGSHVARSTCRGPKITRHTELGSEELAIAYALFVLSGRHRESLARSPLGPTQRDAFASSLRWAQSNGEIVARLETNPEGLAAGDFELMPSRGWLARILSPKRHRLERLETRSS